MQRLCGISSCDGNQHTFEGGIELRGYISISDWTGRDQLIH